MPLHDKAFWVSVFFLAGVLIGSFFSNAGIAVLGGGIATLAAIIVFAVSREHQLIVLALAILFGTMYYSAHNALLIHSVQIPFSERSVLYASVKGIILGSEGNQRAVVSLREPYHGNLAVTLPRYPNLEYGDIVRLTGVPELPSARTRSRLEKDGIFGVMRFPAVERLGSANHFSIGGALNAIEEFSERAMFRALPPESAAFLAGITLGETGAFSREFREKLQATGTSHLVALSGYNIAVVANGALLMLGFFLSRRRAMAAAVVIIFGFVVMTGAEASVVRAAIMAGILMLAEQSRRLYSFRNALAITAALMVAVNPKVLVWDLGFQLSFAAITGIVYVKPAIQSLLKITERQGIFGIRENFLTTIAAEITVVPILLMSVGSAPLIGALVNILVLAVIPLCMGLGFMIVSASLLSDYLARVVGVVAEVPLGYALSVIDFFGRWSPVVEVSRFGGFSVALCYVALLIFVWVMQRRATII